jgi:hypothetical protein
MHATVVVSKLGFEARPQVTRHADVQAHLHFDKRAHLSTFCLKKVSTSPFKWRNGKIFRYFYWLQPLRVSLVNFDSDEKSDRNGVIWLAEDSCDFFINNQNFFIGMKNRSDEKKSSEWGRQQLLQKCWNLIGWKNINFFYRILHRNQNWLPLFKITKSWEFVRLREPGWRRGTITSRLPSVALRAFPNNLNVVVWFPDLIGCGVVDLVS